MTVEHVRFVFNLVGLSTDTKPSTFDGQAVSPGSTFFEKDTDDKYKYDGDSWNLVETNGAGHAHLASSDLALNSSLTESDGMTIAAATVTRQVFPLSGVWDYAIVYVGVMNDVDTLTLEASWDGGTSYSVIDPISLVTGAQLGASGIIPGTADSRAYKMMIHKATHLGFTKTGANATLAFNFYTGITA